MKTSAMILAAGEPGEVKAFRPLVYVGSKTMIRHIVDTLTAVGIDDILVVTGYREDVIRRHLQDCGVSFFRNRFYKDSEMLDSLALGLEHLAQDWERVLVYPADVPLVEAETLRALLRETAPVIRPTCQGKPGHPILIDRETAQVLAAYQGEGGMRGALCSHDLPVLDVEVVDSAVLIDANSDEEISSMQAYAASLDAGQLRASFDLQLAVRTVVMDGEMAQLLGLVEDTGSLQMACECIGSSYSKSWKRVRTLEEQLGIKVLQSSAGGAKGGGSQLTRAGRVLLEKYQNMQKEGQKLINYLFLEHFSSETMHKLQNFE